MQGFADYVKEQIPHVEWLWIDTCCIDQKHGPELSEAINSMFKWYSNAEVRLAYLADVEAVDDLEKFKVSEWFRRGWTLQERLDFAGARGAVDSGVLDERVGSNRSQRKDWPWQERDRATVGSFTYSLSRSCQWITRAHSGRF